MQRQHLETFVIPKAEIMGHEGDNLKSNRVSVESTRWVR